MSIPRRTDLSLFSCLIDRAIKSLVLFFLTRLTELGREIECSDPPRANSTRKWNVKAQPFQTRIRPPKALRKS